MPNDCWNHMVVTGSDEDIKRFQEVEFLHEGKPIPEWALKVRNKGPGALMFKIWSPWQPDFKWLEKLLETYPSIWVKNEWYEEGGSEGVWIGSNKEGQKEIKQLNWEGMCLEEAAHRFREPEPVCKIYYEICDASGVQCAAGRFLQLDCLMSVQDEYKEGKTWSTVIEEIGFRRVEPFPDLTDPKVRKAFGLSKN